MVDLDIRCNFSKCRHILKTNAWVTSCSHAFCEEDGNREFSKDSEENKCPACNTSLPDKYDIVRVNLNPSQQFRSMVLAGLRPEIVIDIALRSISFWNYQIYMENVYQSKCSKHSREVLSQMEQNSNNTIMKLKAENQEFRRNISALKEDLKSQMQRGEELASKFNAKQREINALQAMYESLRRSQLTYIKERNQDAVVGNENLFIRPHVIHTERENVPQLILGMSPEPLKLPVSHREQYQGNSQSQGFNFNPVTPSPGFFKKKWGEFMFPKKRPKLYCKETKY